ncbi:hypothetical protein HW555_008801 [Spodoptera exigua]|uniref:MULE transposase domain-containing protein n=1 Tax=Spodoptera exigua TaxID=7107 RepID=A0A835GA54_SPOEX|nr:hypothetical protein HW555_008801 [Spodoptera exigua]
MYICTQSLYMAVIFGNRPAYMRQKRIQANSYFCQYSGKTELPTWRRRGGDVTTATRHRANNDLLGNRTKGLQSVSQTQLVFEQSERGGLLLLRGGYQHNKKRENKNGTTVWCCVKWQTRKCRGRVVTKNNLVVSDDPHTCQPNFAANIIKKQLNQCRKLAATKSDPIPTLFNNEMSSLADFGLDLVATIPKFTSIKNSLYHSRNKALGVKRTTFQTASAVEIPDAYKDKILLADYTDQRNRIIVFGTHNAKHLLATVEHIFADGTFKICPKPFYQLYTIHGDLGSSEETSNVVPLVYALLLNKKQATYEILFQIIKSQVPDWNPKKFQSDYEAAAMNAMQKIMPNCKISRRVSDTHICKYQSYGSTQLTEAAARQLNTARRSTTQLDITSTLTLRRHSFRGIIVPPLQQLVTQLAQIENFKVNEGRDSRLPDTVRQLAGHAALVRLQQEPLLRVHDRHTLRQQSSLAVHQHGVELAHRQQAPVVSDEARAAAPALEHLGSFSVREHRPLGPHRQEYERILVAHMQVLADEGDLGGGAQRVPDELIHRHVEHRHEQRLVQLGHLSPAHGADIVHSCTSPGAARRHASASRRSPPLAGTPLSLDTPRHPLVYNAHKHATGGKTLLTPLSQQQTLF